MKEEGDREMEQWPDLRSSRGKLGTPSPPSTGRSSVVEGESSPPTSRRPWVVTVLVWSLLGSRVVGPSSQPEGVSRVQEVP